MKKNKKHENEIKQYGIFSNMLFILKNILKRDKSLFIYNFLQIPALVALPLLGIYLPKVIIADAMDKVEASKLLIDIIPILLGIMFSSFIINGFNLKVHAKVSMLRNWYMEDILEKFFNTDYENTDTSKGQTKLMRSEMAMDGDGSPVHIMTGIFPSLISNIIGFVLYAGIISMIHPILTLAIILVTLTNFYIENKVNKYEYKNKENIAPLEKKLAYIKNKTGDFKAAKDMRLYGMTDWFRDTYSMVLKKWLYYQKKVIVRKNGASLLDGILSLIVNGIVYGFLIYSVIYKNMPVADFVFLFGATIGISTWFAAILKNFNDVSKSNLQINDLRDFLEQEDRTNRNDGIKLPESFELPCDIELKDLYYKYDKADDYTIKNINLKIKKGEKLALVGVNGAGKTTLVKLICGLYLPTKGEILINEKSSLSYNLEDYFSLFSVVFQDSHLLPVSLERNIASTKDNIIDHKRVDEAIEMSGLKQKIDLLPKGKETKLVKSVYEDAVDLSGGELQKLMLAKALYKDGKILILDEPTAALDPIAENEIYQKYNELTKNKTSIYISHRLSSTRFCDNIVFIENGEIIEIGTHNELMNTNGKYKEMYDMQSHYYKDNLEVNEGKKGASHE